jgi:hypothetical protein
MQLNRNDDQYAPETPVRRSSQLPDISSPSRNRHAINTIY